jgi:hypothetical protein
LSREFGKSVSDGDLLHLGKYEAISQIATGDAVSPPLTITTIEPARGYGTTKPVRYASG